MVPAREHTSSTATTEPPKILAWFIRAWAESLVRLCTFGPFAAAGPGPCSPAVVRAAFASFARAAGDGRIERRAPPRERKGEPGAPQAEEPPNVPSRGITAGPRQAALLEDVWEPEEAFPVHAGALKHKARLAARQRFRPPPHLAGNPVLGAGGQARASTSGGGSPAPPPGGLLRPWRRRHLHPPPPPRPRARPPARRGPPPTPARPCGGLRAGPPPPRPPRPASGGSERAASYSLQAAS